MTTLARVLANDTDMDSMPDTIAVAVRHTIGLCLQKNQKKRNADIRDVKLALEGAFEASAETAAVAATPPPTLAVRVLPPAAAPLAGLVVAGLSVFALTRPAPPTVSWFDVTPPGQTTSFLDMARDGERFLVISLGAVDETTEPARTILVQNWSEELQRFVPVD